MATILNPKWLLSLLFISMFSLTYSQQNRSIIQDYLQENASTLGLSSHDILDWKVTREIPSKKQSFSHVYIQQRLNGIPVHNAVANFSITKEGQVAYMGNRLLGNLSAMANSSSPGLVPKQAVLAAAEQLGLFPTEELTQKESINENEFLFSSGGISLKNIPVKLVYQPMPEGELRLSWDVSIYELDAEKWWSLRIDDETGNILEKNNRVIHCDFGKGGFCLKNDANHLSEFHSLAESPMAPTAIQASESYNVFAIPVESPSHGPRTLETDPANLTASPFGWHDNDGATGAEFTITQGNNVVAYLDSNNDNTPNAGDSPDGGTALEFDFVLDLNQDPIGYQNVAITNLFYMNNIMHDVWYHYGFDEESGNFQDNNYGNGGQDDDYVFAEAQDGGGTNNANFATDDDGFNPRMQMYLWGGGGGAAQLLTVNEPPSISGAYTATEATFGPGVPSTPITENVVLVDDDTAPNPNDACEAIVNGAAINGKIAMIDRGDCLFTEKVQAAQDEGAVAVIIVNNVNGAPINMGGTSATVTIPSIMISQADGDLLKAELNSGNPVNATIVNDDPSNFDRDGDFDNGIIAHEYGHGISTRLTGGANNSGCLFGDEQMGEGWSDWFGMMLTMDMSVANPVYRPIGTYAIGEPTNGFGIRNAPYDTSFAVNDYTYADVADAGNVSVPHGVGFVWATMLWDMTWALINEYGFDPNVYTGTGGNNMAMQLVIDGLKIQPCNPGFVDGRDAILLADQNNFGGANQCLIWKAFAKRGCGYSASQGSGQSRSDQTEAFDLPPQCLTAVVAPVAAFSVSPNTSCDGKVSFSDNSTDIPQQWEWDFGDGNTSTLSNPDHTYTTEGTYTVTLTVSNTIGTDATTQTVVVDFPDPAIGTGNEGCAGSSVLLSATGTNTIQWVNGAGEVVFEGDNFSTPPLNGTTTYQAFNAVTYPPQYVGPSSGTIGSGGYHGTTFTGTVNFNSQSPLVIVSAWVDADGAGDRELFLWDGADGTGNVLQQVVVNIPAGPGRVNLGFEVPGAGTYSIGGTGVNLYRNDGGPNYPYDLSGLMTITGSSAGPEYYYYLYDLEVQKAPCRSNPIPVTATIYGAEYVYTANGLTLDFSSTSSGATDWSWDFGDGNTSNLENPSHTYSSDGLYEVSLSINGGFCAFTDTVVAGNVSMENGMKGLSFDILPNPATDFLTLELSHSVTQNLSIEILSLDGRVVLKDVLTSGIQKKTLSLVDLPSAVYFLKLDGEAISVARKVVVQQ